MKVKLYFSIFFVVWLFRNHLQAQCYWDSNKGINTTLGSTFNAIPDFSWKATDYFVYTKSSQTVATSIKSPFTGLSNANENIDGFIRQDVKDYEPSEGWEMLIRNFGASNDPYKFPTLVLYNRYLGIIRTFVYVPEDDNFDRNTGKIEIKFIYPNAAEKKESALLSPLSGLQNPLDKFKKRIISTAVQKSYLKGLFWMYADFPVTYDPCSCNHFTEITIQPSFINIQSVDLKTSFLTANVLSSGSAQGLFSGFSQPFEFLGKGVEAGNKKGIAIGKSIGDIAGTLNTFVLPSFDTKTKFLAFGMPIENTTVFEVPNQFRIPDFMKKAGMVGSFLGILDYFISGGGTTAMSNSNVNYNITGSIIDSIGGQKTNIYVPGTPWGSSGLSNAVKSRPYYNNTLGVFSLLETPKSQFAFNDPIPTGAQGQDQIVKMRLDKNMISKLKYVVNPASNLEPVSISAALVLDGSFAQVPTNFNHSQDPIVNSSVNVLEQKGIIPEQGYRWRVFTFSSPSMSFECLKDYVLEVKVPDSRFGTIVPKLLLNVTLKESTTGKLFYYVSQYKLNPDKVQLSDLSINEFSSIPLNVAINDLNLTSDLTIKAWQKIKVSGNVQTNGFKLNLVAGGTVDIDPVNLNANITIEIKTPADCPINLPQPLSGPEVQAFCQSAAYNPIVPISSLSKNDTNNNYDKEQIEFRVSPNPFTNQITIDLNIEEATNANLDLSNAVGQTLKSRNLGIKEKGSYQETIETSDLAPGIYFLTLRTQNGTETKKIVKQ